MSLDQFDDIPVPAELSALVERGLVDWEPWGLMESAEATTRRNHMRTRYPQRYIPFARRFDCDDVACFDAGRPGRVVVVHDFASPGRQERQEPCTFQEWFASLLSCMVEHDLS